MIRIGILKADSADPALLSRFGDIDNLIRTMLDSESPDLFHYQTFEVQYGEFPPDVRDFDAFLVTGSKAGVYEEDYWIADLIDFINRAFHKRRKLVGICFGHQAIAQALGGHVEKFEGGWGVGVHLYKSLNGVESTYEAKRLRLLACHQDQVLRLPPDAECTLTSEFCRFAGFKINDQVLTVQPHPEFDPYFLEHILRSNEERIGERAEHAIKSLQLENDSDQVISRLICFLTKSE